jgi:thiosulfate/3-mercaptopyruvate sulfurtransferase
MKKLALILALAMTLGLVGCGNSATKDTSGKSAGSTSAGSAQTETAAFTGDYVVDAAYVKKNLDNIVLVDARGDEAAAKETIKGAIPLMWQYLATCEDGKPGEKNWGCILDLKRLNKRLGEKGLDPNKEIVLFAAAQKGWGEDGRIAWELLAAGYKDVKIVNGGFDALKNAGLETAKGGATPKAVTVDVKSIDQTHDINTDELKENYSDYKVVDVRADEEYDGKTLYGEAKGGHLPDAIHIRFTDLFQDNGQLKSKEDITAMFEKAGLSKDDSIVTYCTAGIRSAYMQLILEMCGYQKVKNYDESYYRWCAVETVEK